MAYQSYRDLDIYKNANKLAIEVHQMSLKLPRFETYEGGSQIRRASKSIKSNIVEGFGRRRYKQEFIKFLVYALASCDETLDHLDTLFESKSLKDKDKYLYMREEYNRLGKMINSFIKAVDLGHKSSIKCPASSIQDPASRHAK